MAALDRDTSVSMMKERNFSLSMISNGSNGEAVTMYFITEPTELKGKVISPAFGCEVRLEDAGFRFIYAVPKSINKLETPWCSPVTNEDHFYNICVRFETAAAVLMKEFDN